ncbi:endo-1,4-beta-xylanase [Massilia antarctica]|uniref:endo-1,4-beta-xylanase n=1 Tax=Massilia antarctica TaxID=2765360 RepID=UPI0006BD560D|nr:endo-1,4-beta-xylanase [Massilia sp. H27-R4]MCY0912229.1 endo-1,4-beta-xylanase [Massilia sp. H27-R4]CUI06276.1 Endo-1,4-beta-xylanase A precursor [Janthinobacterium sp. CG23_2]CUU30062.1 Endo-1,4-beta-xylanase A precursor [Janthinobacterium sp. CG23_2]
MRFTSATFSVCLLLSACGGDADPGSPTVTPAPPAVADAVADAIADAVPAADDARPPAMASEADDMMTGFDSGSSEKTSATGVSRLSRLAKFPVGVSLSYGNEAFSYNNNPAQQAAIKTHFSQLTAGNIMKMSYLHPARDTYNFTQADDFLKFARDNGKTLHAHTLIWHSDYQVPAFMKNYQGDKAAWLAMLKTHVQTIATHFSGKVASWDVVNEAINDGGGYRNSIFYQKTGADYIEQAFINARAVDKKADLYYNDYNIEADTAKLQTLTNMLDGFKARSVPISGVGFQMHIFMDYPSVSTISAAFKRAVDRNLKVKISELDIPINNPFSAQYKAGDIKRELTPALALAQKKRYCEVVKAYMDTVPAKLRGGVTVWGVSDPSSWLIADLFKNAHADWPLLFDGGYQQKPALRGVADGLSGKACTNT